MKEKRFFVSHRKNHLSQLRVFRIGTFLNKRINPKVKNNATTVTNGISITGDISSKLILNPNKPLFSVSKTMTWKKKIGKVFALIAWVNLLSRGWLLLGQFFGYLLKSMYKATEAKTTFADVI